MCPKATSIRLIPVLALRYGLAFETGICNAAEIRLKAFNVGGEVCCTHANLAPLIINTNRVYFGNLVNLSIHLHLPYKFSKSAE